MTTNIVICNSKAAAVLALEAIARTLPKGTQKDALCAIKDWIEKNYPQDFTPEIRERIQRIWEGSEWEQAGRAWIDSELSDSGYIPGMLASDGCHFSHEMINVPTDGAETQCFWNAGKQAWEPVGFFWPDIMPRQDFEPDEGETE